MRGEEAAPGKFTGAPSITAETRRAHQHCCVDG